MNKIQKLAVGLSTVGAGISAMAMKAFAAADAAVATSVTTAGAGLKENLISGLETALPYIFAVAAIFWAVRFVMKKVQGRAH